jgi:hypothetical protein
MFKYIIAFAIGSPLWGIFLVEDGYYGISIGLAGYPNGATLAYVYYAALAISIAYMLLPSFKNRCPREVVFKSTDISFARFSKMLIVITISSLIIFNFGYGAIDVWTGSIGKGEFRTKLGLFGAVPHLLTKTLLPALLAYAASLYVNAIKSKYNRNLLYLNMFLVFLFGASWGFKAAAVWMLLPSILIINWKISTYRMLIFILFFMASIFSFFYIFDFVDQQFFDVAEILFVRLTVIQGDVSWLIWNYYKDGYSFPSYSHTLWAAFGDKALSLFGVSIENPENWMKYHYDWIITNLAGADLQTIADGHNITATPFSEGLIAGGALGLFSIAIFAGILIGYSYRILNYAIGKNQYFMSALGASYFCFNIFPWLNGGGLVQLFHIAVVFNFLVTAIVLRLMISVSKKRRLHAKEKFKLNLKSHTYKSLPPIL